jgi:predicted aspartyl protease
MQINGEWLLCDDGIERPAIRGEILSDNSSWRAVEFLVDTGADRTILSANVFESLNLRFTALDGQIGGVGGMVKSVGITTQIRLTCDDTTKVAFRGEYAACIEYESLDMSVLGRDIMAHFAVIVDRSKDMVCLLRERHSFNIVKS